MEDFLLILLGIAGMLAVFALAFWLAQYLARFLGFQNFEKALNNLSVMSFALSIAAVLVGFGIPAITGYF